MAYFEYIPRRTLYHYTSIDAFKSIIVNKELWLSDLTSSNDPKEMSFGFDEIKKIIEEMKKNKSSPNADDIIYAFEGPFIKYYSATRAYVACLSMVPDSLPMWTMYGGASYTGLSIGFRPTALMGLPARIQKVQYQNPSSHNISDFILDRLSGLDFRNPQIIPYHSQVVDIFALITSLKHDPWSYEDEVRILHVQVKEKPDENVRRIMPWVAMVGNKQFGWEEPLERMGSGGPIKYKKFKFGRVKGDVVSPAGAIDEIVIGPKCELTDFEVTNFLNKNGFVNFRVRKSSCYVR